jgi:putative ribosome biogenesis GTPase RsgA
MARTDIKIKVDTSELRQISRVVCRFYKCVHWHQDCCNLKLPYV